MQPDDSSACLPDDLFELNDRQLKLLWENRRLSVHEIQQAARSLKQSSSSPQKQQQLTNSSNDETLHLSGLYYFSDQQGTESTKESDLAVRLCQLLSELALLRFRLVPSRLKEDKFWIATFLLLKERLVEYNAARYDGNAELLSLDDDNNTNSANGDSDNAAAAASNGNGPTNTQSSSTVSNEQLSRQVQLQKVQIAKLKRQVQELEASLAKASAASNSSPSKSNGSSTNKSVVSNKASTPNTSNHKGAWKMDKDSQEFLTYPDEVKESLRAEKQRRLQQVQQEMKFILDSDEVHHSNGKWECCGQPKYHASCSM